LTEQTPTLPDEHAQPTVTDTLAVESAPGPSSTHYALDTFQTVLTALILAFVFRAFFIEPFIIPTGSMAESLLGLHGTTVCPHCGWEYDYSSAAGTSTARRGFEAPGQVTCPNCQREAILQPPQDAAKSGDRILVHKWPYLLGGLLGPQRWDVIVFRDPANPTQNYIKRLVGLPGDAVEIIDGDLYVNGRIARKTPAAQSVLWFVVFDQDHLPRRDQDSRRRSPWTPDQPLNSPALGWYGLDTRVIHYGGLDETPRSITFDPAPPSRYLRDVYGYNHEAAGNYVKDLRLVAEVTVRHGRGWCDWELTHRDRRFSARLAADGTVALRIEPADGGDAVTLGPRRPRALDPSRPTTIEFAHVDYRVYLKVDGREVLASTRAAYAPPPDPARCVPQDQPARLRVTACSLALELRGLRIDRDVYYSTRGASTLRASAGDPFTLREGEYFVLGDNSPRSHDSREWYRHAAYLPDEHRPGVVPANQIVGRGFFVYLPGLLPLGERGWWRIPDFGRMRFIR
jgi:signal peptidase I